MKTPIITLTTDFGTADHYVAAMKGVILGICPGAVLVDISHEVAPYAIAQGAYLIAQAWRTFPKGTVHIVVVDPGVGSERRPILAEVEGHRFVAPDNGVLSMVRESANPGKIREITCAKYFRHPVSQTFHGRDVFAPVAARIADGLAPSRVGALISDEMHLQMSRPRQIGPRKWEGNILHVDRFGNVVTNFSLPDWADLHKIPFRMIYRQKKISRVALSYSAMKGREWYLIAGSAGYWEVSCNQGSIGKIPISAVGSKLHLEV